MHTAAVHSASQVQSGEPGIHAAVAVNLLER